MSGEDIGNVDAVQSEAEAIRRAEALLEKADEHRIKFMEKRSKELGRDRIEKPYIYTLGEIETYPQGWILDFWRAGADGGTIDPPFVNISVNRKTGETKFGDFRDE
jgi:hypothetical protein